MNGNSAALIVIFTILFCHKTVFAQDYEVSNIDCSYGELSLENNLRVEQRLSATLKKPANFAGSPIFADDRSIKPEKDTVCQIRSDPSSDLKYQLLITDLDSCGVVIKNGFINVRVWFPKLPGVVMMSDQEVIIMCKPPERVVTQNKAAGFAGALPPAARVSGVVQESPGTLEYEVALYREATQRSEDGLTVDIQDEIPVDQAVPIGTKLQLRATINDNSAWKFVKLHEVTISTNPKNAYSAGHITLVKDGCRQDEFSTIVPRQPYRPESSPNEVRLEFEAVLLDVNKDRKNQLWIHAKIKACVAKGDCEAEFCLDLYQPSGMGRRRKRSEPVGQVEYFYPSSRKIQSAPLRIKKNDTNLRHSSTDINDNIGVTVIMPEEHYYSDKKSGKNTEKSPKIIQTESLKKGPDCQLFIVIGAVLGCLVVAASLMMCLLSIRLLKLTRKYKREKLEGVVREHRMKFGSQPAIFDGGNSQFVARS